MIKATAATSVTAQLSSLPRSLRHDFFTTRVIPRAAVKREHSAFHDARKGFPLRRAVLDYRSRLGPCSRVCRSAIEGRIKSTQWYLVRRLVSWGKQRESSGRVPRCISNWSMLACFHATMSGQSHPRYRFRERRRGGKVEMA